MPQTFLEVLFKGLFNDDLPLWLYAPLAASLSCTPFNDGNGGCRLGHTNVSLAYILKIMLNRMISEPDVNPFIALIGPIAIYLGISFTVNTAFRLYNYFVEYQMIPVLRKQISTQCLDHLLTLSHQFYQNNFAGSLGSKVSELVMAIPDLLKILIDRFFSYALTLSIAILTLWQVNARFSLSSCWSGLLSF